MLKGKVLRRASDENVHKKIDTYPPSHETRPFAKGGKPRKRSGSVGHPWTSGKGYKALNSPPGTMTRQGDITLC